MAAILRLRRVVQAPVRRPGFGCLGRKVFRVNWIAEVGSLRTEASTPAPRKKEGPPSDGTVPCFEPRARRAGSAIGLSRPRAL
jgi:hypothetical protein